MNDWKPYPYQELVQKHLLEGRSVVLQAPTGAGKTRAALMPFLHARRHLPPDQFPRKCIYSVPMRVLANQFHEEHQKIVRSYGWQHDLNVTIQTGARPEDLKMEGDLIFTTIDQTLSNFLNIPYALSLSQGNLNAGAILSSYLVFDELHLYDPEAALSTTLHLLKKMKGVIPFLVMTATLSAVRVRALAKELDAEPLVLTSEEASAIPSQQKTRRIRRVDAMISAQDVWKHHKHRSVAICNTVERAQTLYGEIKQLADPAVDVRLLHSRFLRTDRDASEAWLQREFGKDKAQHTVKSAILIATQVVEVGLDISSEALHTELAPAASVIQRAGRCARYQDEEGDVFVYRLPINEEGEPKYAPYHTGGEKEICERTWDALPDGSDTVCDFERELKIVDQAHGKADELLMAKLSAQHYHTTEHIAHTIATQDRGAARELIRDVDSRAVIVHPEPASIENPWDYEGFGIFLGSLIGAYPSLEAMADKLGVEWVMMTAKPLPEDEESQRARTVWWWRPIKDKDDLAGAILVAVNPALACYSAEVGFQLGTQSDPGWQSPPREKEKASRPYTSYRRETLVEHTARMMRIYRYPFFDRASEKKRLPLAEELACAARRLEEKQHWPRGTLDRLIRLAIVAHDLGKTDTRWQRWAHNWQVEVSRLRRLDLIIPDDYIAAHTDYNEQDETEKTLNQKIGRQKPHHAAEGTGAVVNWLFAQSGNDQPLAQAVVTALIRHHSAGARGNHDKFQAHPAAAAIFPQMLAEADLDTTGPQKIAWTLPRGEELINRQVRWERDAELITYLLIVRALRLADQRSQMWD